MSFNEIILNILQFINPNLEYVSINFGSGNPDLDLLGLSFLLLTISALLEVKRNNRKANAISQREIARKNELKLLRDELDSLKQSQRVGSNRGNIAKINYSPLKIITAEASGNEIHNLNEKSDKSRLNEKFKVSREGWFSKLKSIFSKEDLNQNKFIEELEELLISSDVGPRVTADLLASIKSELGNTKGSNITQEQLLSQMQARLEAIFSSEKDDFTAFNVSKAKPFIVMIVGVNGVGKTTTCAKLAEIYKDKGLEVRLIAADTFRAAAVEQLRHWGDKLGVVVGFGKDNAKPSGVVFDCLKDWRDENIDLILIDTAGRLHTKNHLMQELSGVVSVIKKHYTDAPQETILVVDGTSGQNALIQAETFSEVVPLSGLIVTKLDSTAKGGIVFAIKDKLGIPLKYIGIGETSKDLIPFVPKDFISALLGKEPNLSPKTEKYSNAC
jgi:fused signal recognition particle receptor